MYFLLSHENVGLGLWAVLGVPDYSCEKQGRSKWGNAGFLYTEKKKEKNSKVLGTPFAATTEEGKPWASVTRTCQR